MERKNAVANGSILVFVPTGTKKAKEKIGAPRLLSLAGKRIGIIWNGKLGGDVFLDRVSEVLGERCDARIGERINDRGDTNKVIDQSVVNRLVATCDAVVIGTGD
jgi:hypothetical protein